MVGILGGILGGDQANFGTGILGSMNNTMTNNAGMLLGMGAGLLSGDGWGAGLQGAQQGMVQDQRTRLIKQEQAEREQARVAAQQLAEKVGAPELAAFPSLAGQLYMAQKTPKAPSWGVVAQDDYGNNQYGWIDPRSRSITPHQSTPQGQGQVLPPQTSDAVTIPPAPAGVNPKIWRDEQTKRLANAGKPTEKMRSDMALAERTAANIKSELQNLHAQVQQHGAEALPTEAKARMQTTFTNIQMQLKNLYELGAITGPDMEILSKLITDPTVNPANPLEWGKGFNMAGRNRAQIDEMIKIIDRSLENARRANGGEVPSAQGAAQGRVFQHPSGATIERLD